MIKRKNIGFLVSSLAMCGPTKQLLYIIKYMNLKKFKPIILTIKKEGENSLSSSFKDLGIEIVCLNLSSVSYFFRGKKLLKQQVNFYNLELLHSSGIRADFLASSINQKISTIATVRNFPFIDLPSSYGYFLGNLAAHFQTYALKRIGTVVGVSESVQKNIIIDCKIVNALCIKNGIDDFTVSLNYDTFKEDFLANIGKNSQAKIWLVLGNLEMRKGIVQLLDFWKNLETKTGKDILLLVGSGSLEQEVRDRASFNSSIKVIGHTDEVEKYLFLADYLISNSCAEGLPNSVLEAMKSGLPMLLTDISPHKEFEIEKKNFGFYFKLDDCESFKEAFTYLKRGNYLQMSLNALDTVNEYSADKMSKKYQRLYEK